MMLKVVFFARLKEQIGTDQISIELTQQTTVKEIKQALIALHPHWQTALSATNLLAAVNHDIVTEDAIVQQGDELAFFPPVTGG